MTASNVETLTQINLDDLISSFGWQNRPFLARLLRWFFISPPKEFAHQMVEFDSFVGQHALPHASRLTLSHYVDSLHVYGRERIPQGAFLALSNHPGMSDTLSLFASLNRTDLKIIALNRPFLNALPNTSKQLFYLKDDPASRDDSHPVRDRPSATRWRGAYLSSRTHRTRPGCTRRRTGIALCMDG